MSQEDIYEEIMRLVDLEFSDGVGCGVRGQPLNLRVVYDAVLRLERHNEEN